MQSKPSHLNEPHRGFFCDYEMFIFTSKMLVKQIKKYEMLYTCLNGEICCVKNFIWEK